MRRLKAGDRVRVVDAVEGDMDGYGPNSVSGESYIGLTGVVQAVVSADAIGGSGPEGDDPMYSVRTDRQPRGIGDFYEEVQGRFIPRVRSFWAEELHRERSA